MNTTVTSFIFVAIRRSLPLACLLLALSPSLAPAELVTFRFEAVLDYDPGSSIDFDMGQRITGRYTFDTNAPKETSASPNTFTHYPDAVTDVIIHVHGYGTARGDGTNSSIWVGNPVQTVGSYNYLSDQYRVAARATGVTVPTTFGSPVVVGMQIALQDIDMTAFASEDLFTTPPDLSQFLDSDPAIPTDSAQFFLAFESGAYDFQLTLLRLIPEPSSFAMLGTLMALSLANRRTR